jgi:hypothetical protein
MTGGARQHDESLLHVEQWRSVRERTRCLFFGMVDTRWPRTVTGVLGTPGLLCE